MRDRRYKNLTVRAFAAGTGLSVIVGTFAAPLTTMAVAKDMEKPVVLRVCNWEEYIDEGGWEDDELIDLPSEDIFGENSLVSDFEEWYLSAEQKNPLLQYVKQQIEVSRKEVKLNKAMRFPKFSAGYSLEKTLGQKYQGANIGISIPLWENKNRVKQAKAGVIAAQTREQESKQQFYNRLQNLYMRANGLQQTAAGYRKSLQSLNNTDLLMKALDVGEINLLNYIVEIGLYYDTVNQTLAAERDFEKALADLSAVEL